jgi:hypothetical protein
LGCSFTSRHNGLVEKLNTPPRGRWPRDERIGSRAHEHAKITIATTLILINIFLDQGMVNRSTLRCMRVNDLNVLWNNEITKNSYIDRISDLNCYI